MAIKNNFLIFGTTLILLLQITPSSAVYLPRTNCNIRVDDPHISKSIRLNKGFSAVKVNARSKCAVEMSNLSLTVEIYKKGFLRSYLVRETTRQISNQIPAGLVIKNKSTWIRCKSSRNSQYFGVAYASAYVLDKPASTLRVRSANTVSLPCGT